MTSRVFFPIILSFSFRFPDNSSDRVTTMKLKKQHFSTPNISASISPIGLKCQNMFNWFLINTVHYNQIERKNVEILVHLTFKQVFKALGYIIHVFFLLSRTHELFKYHLQFVFSPVNSKQSNRPAVKDPEGYIAGNQQEISSFCLKSLTITI